MSSGFATCWQLSRSFLQKRNSQQQRFRSWFAMQLQIDCSKGCGRCFTSISTGVFYIFFSFLPKTVGIANFRVGPGEGVGPGEAVGP